MSEVPRGIDLPPVHRRPPRPSASIMITRDGQKGLEVLLCRRVDELPAFPGFWAFPGGGRSRVDAEAVDRLPQLAEHGPDLGAALASMMRELVEEIGLNAEGHRLRAVDPSHRARVLADRRGWLELVLEGSLRCDPSGIRLLGRRTTPPFGPMRFENTFLHLHLEHDSAFVPMLDQQTEFDDHTWATFREVLEAWRSHRFKVPPPIVSILSWIDLGMSDGAEFDDAVRSLASIDQDRIRIRFAHGVEVLPIPTATLPPADHTNAYLIGPEDGEQILIDPAVRSEAAMSIVRSAVRRTEQAGGTLIGIMYTHRHADHLGDPKLLSELGVPVFGSEGTAKVTHIDRILSDGVILELRGPTTRHEWKVLETPGHCPGHLCLMSPAGLIAGDMVAGVGTILIPPESGDMLVYLTQLERLRALEPHLIFPSHGPLVATPDRLLDRYLRHRRARHDRVRVAVDQASDPVRIAALAYADSPDAHPGLALDQTYAHLLALEKEGIVRSDGARWFTA